MSPLSELRPPPRRLLPLWEGRTPLFATGLFLTFLVALLALSPPLLVQQAELRLFDLMQPGRAAPSGTQPVVLVGIDEESLATYGQWPWPRYRLGKLVERLHGMGAKVVALDFLMPEPDRTSPGIVVSERRRDEENGSFLIQPMQKDSNSQRLADAMGKGNTAIGYFLDFSDTAVPVPRAEPAAPSGMTVSSAAGATGGWPDPRGMIRSIPEISAAAAAEGFTNARHDLDGALRRVPLMMKLGGKLYPSLALSALLLAHNDRNLRIIADSSETELIWNNHRIPLDREGNLLLAFRDQPSSFPYISARSVLDGSTAAAQLREKIVLVGPWAKGLGDFHLSPSGRSVSGLTVHATVIDNILSNNFIMRPSWAPGAELLAIVLLGTLCSWIMSRSGFAWSLLAVAAGSTGCYAGGKELLASGGVYLSPLLPMLTPLVVMMFLSLLKYGIEARKVRQRTRDLIEAQDTIIFSMSTLTAARDKETGGHILRTQRYVEILARQLATIPTYRDLDETGIELLAKSAPLHDIGKVGIPDRILNKAGDLDEDEYTIMKSHTLIGAQAIRKTISGSIHPEQLDFLQYAQQMIESHHEHWDGSGYPHGLKGGDIPLAGRLMALADVYDAMISRRVYKEEIPHDKTREFILKNSGKHFDPDVVAAFVATQDQFQRIAQEHGDDGDT